MKHQKSLYRQLFFSTLKLSAFTFGGGYVIVSLMRKRFIEELHWIEEDEMLDMISIAQSSPGPIAVNASLIVGYHLAGIGGALLAVLGTAIPPLFTISVISFFYMQFRSNEYVSNMMLGMQAGVAAVIASVVIDFISGIVKTRSVLSIILMAAVFIAVYFLKISIPIIIISCAAIGLISGRIASYRRKKRLEHGGGRS